MKQRFDLVTNYLKNNLGCDLELNYYLISQLELKALHTPKFIATPNTL